MGPTTTRSEGTARVSQRRLLERSLGVPFTEGNELVVLRNGAQIFPAMLEAIDSAERAIDFETYVYWHGDVAWRFARSLADRARHGVRVRVLLDGVGCGPMPDDIGSTMRDAGVDLRVFRPPASWRLWRLDHRTHRKILVVDGRVGFTGGVGIATEWEGDARHPGEWRDTHVRVRGPALDGLHAGFIGNWMELVGTIDHSSEIDVAAEAVGDVPVLLVRSVAAIGWSDIALLYHLLIHTARQRLRIVTPYFVPDDASTGLLCAAARRGVEVEIMVCDRHNDSRLSLLAGRRSYQSLLDAGVRLHLYEHTMLHTKAITVDGALTCLGSPNFNQRSMRKDEELCLVADSARIATEIDAHFDDDLRACHTPSPDEWRARGPLERGKERLAGLLRSEV